MSRRDKIRLSDSEIRAFLLESKTLTIVSHGPGGFPHPMPMWFALDDDLSVRITTYAKSQKVHNIERDSRVSILVESGEVYEELKGVVFYGHAELIHDIEQVIDALADINRFDRADPKIREGMQGNAAKRVVIRVRPERIVSWDHSKLGGVY